MDESSGIGLIAAFRKGGRLVDRGVITVAEFNSKAFDDFALVIPL